jgi:RimJ/RimL family protein N-acetyltransferase/SAM-dependent methyltransferase
MSSSESTSTRPRVTVDPTYGYRHLDPYPTTSEFERFYQSEYYDLLRKGGRAPELRRLLAGGEKGEQERAWLRETLYADITTGLREHGSGPRVLDIGCGQGELLRWLVEHDFEADGIEPSDDAAALARERGLNARTATLEELLADPPRPYAAALLLNVLEHVPHPEEMLRGISDLLEPGGLLYIRVPNDFNPLQASAQAKLGAEPWWIAVPDHVNSFDVESLCALCRMVGFEPVDVQADFPMELFLLMGLDYIGDPELGAQCHEYRVQAERSMDPEVRRDLFRAFAANGVGRNTRLLVRKVGSEPAAPGLPAERDGYRYLPLRRADIEPLRRFRNAQMDVLRQSAPISAPEQERWFDEVVAWAQRAPRPPMMLVSILDGDDRFIGYGGLTNLDWDARRAEVSFLVDPARAADPGVYAHDFTTFLRFIADWAFGDLALNRLFTETFEFREAHIALLEQAGFRPEGRMRQHVATGDSVLHGLLASDPR